MRARSGSRPGLVAPRLSIRRAWACSEAPITNPYTACERPVTGLVAGASARNGRAVSLRREPEGMQRAGAASMYERVTSSTFSAATRVPGGEGLHACSGLPRTVAVRSLAWARAFSLTWSTEGIASCREAPGGCRFGGHVDLRLDHVLVRASRRCDALRVRNVASATECATASAAGPPTCGARAPRAPARPPTPRVPRCLDQDHQRSRT